MSATRIFQGVVYTEVEPFRWYGGAHGGTILERGPGVIVGYRLADEEGVWFADFDRAAKRAQAHARRTHDEARAFLAMWDQEIADGRAV